MNRKFIINFKNNNSSSLLTITVSVQDGRQRRGHASSKAFGSHFDIPFIKENTRHVSLRGRTAATRRPESVRSHTRYNDNNNK